LLEEVLAVTVEQVEAQVDIVPLGIMKVLVVVLQQKQL
jgi:hypothetical protein